MHAQATMNEQHFSVLPQAVHFVQQLVQEGLLVWSVHVGAFASDEINIFYHH